MKAQRRHGPIFLAIAAATGPLAAELAINPAATITRRVEVQPIRVSNTSGTAATTFGSAANEAYIKGQINRVWSQAGIRIDWLPLVEYTNNFAYDGAPENNPRPVTHLNQILSQAPSPPKSPSAIVVNLFFVQIVPGFAQRPANVVNGYAIVDGNGLTVYVGTTLFGTPNGPDGISRVIAHEIGHNLGLDHVANGMENLMSPSGTTGRLTETQIQTVFTNNAGTDGFDLIQPLPSSNYSQWAAANNVLNGPTGDDDADGMDNLIEFMLQKNPKAGDSPPLPARAANGLTWTLAKHAPALADGIAYRVTTSASLSSWAPAGSDSGRSVIVQDDNAALAVRLVSGGSARFMRMDVTVPATITPATLMVAEEPPPEPRMTSDPVDTEAVDDP